MSLKIGQGIDIHNLVLEKTKQKLGGVEFDLDYKIIAHSDGDIIIHALCSAISGALSLSDLGTYFSDKDKKNKDLDSLVMLDFFLTEMKKQSYEFSNIDITIVCEKIYFKNLSHEILNKLKKILNTNNISLKATRYEKESMQIQCNCVLLLIKKNLKNEFII